MKCGNSESLDSATVLGAVPLHRGAGFAVDMSARPAFSFRVIFVLAVFIIGAGALYGVWRL